MVVDDLTPVDDALAGLHHPVCQRDTVQNVFSNLVRRCFVIRDILGQVIIDIAGLQYRLFQIRGTVVDDELVGRFDCE